MHLRQTNLSSHPSQDPLKGDAFLASLPLLNHTREQFGRQQANADPAPARGHQHSALDVDGTIHPDGSRSRHALGLQPRGDAEAPRASRTTSALRADARRAPATRRDAHREQRGRHRRRRERGARVGARGRRRDRRARAGALGVGRRAG